MKVKVNTCLISEVLVVPISIKNAWFGCQMIELWPETRFRVVFITS